MKKNSGITLVALVVTIVVLLILAGITITMLFGENGIIKKAQQAKEETERDQQETMEGIQDLVDQMGTILNGNESSDETGDESGDDTGGETGDTTGDETDGTMDFTLLYYTMFGVGDFVCDSTSSILEFRESLIEYRNEC